MLQQAPTFSSPPPRYDTANSSTSLKPYLQLPHILSLAWLAYPIISLLFVIFRLQLSLDNAQSSIANAKDDLLTACQAAEQAATAAASMPRYLAIATNHQFADAANGLMNGSREALVLALTCMEAIINFLIDIYRSTFLCFLELVVGGGLDLLISAVQDITSFLQNSLNSIVSGLKSDATSLNSAIQTAVNAVNKINPFGNIQAPQFNVSSLDAISNITIPTDFENALIQLNNSLPSVSSIKNTIQDLVDTPFEAVKADINNTFLGLAFDPTLLPVPAQNTVSFCSNFDTSAVDNLGKDLVEVARIGTIILIAVFLLLLAGHCVLEWYKWCCLMNHLRNTREAWLSDPTTRYTSHITSSSAPSVTLTNHNLLMLQTDAQHPLLTRIAYTLATRLRFSPSQHTHLRWFLHYIFHPPALACFLIGFFGLLSVQIQLIAIGPLEAQYTAQVSASTQDLSNTIAMQMNNSMYNQSSVYANSINAQVETVQSTINNGLFGWVNGTTTTLNSTLNNFYSDVQNLVGTIFNGTILESPTQDFIKCLIGSKVNAIEEALTFLNQNLQVDIPRLNETVLVLSPSDVDEITQPIATAAIGGTSNNPHGLVGRLVASYIDSLKKERWMFSIFMGLWGVVVLMGLTILFWHSYAKNWIDAYKRRKWRKEQRDDLEGRNMPFREQAPMPYAGDTEKGPGMADPPLRSFTPLPETRSPFSVNLFRRPSQPSPALDHPLKSLEPTFEKSWDSFFHEGAGNKQPEASGLRCVISRPMKLMNFGKKGDKGLLETPEGDRLVEKPKSAWFKPVVGLFAKNSVPPDSLLKVGSSPSGSLARPELVISIERASAATPKDLPKIDGTPSPVHSEQVSPKPPTLPWNIPPKKAVPLTIPPPPPGRPWNTRVSTGAGFPDRSPLAMPLHNAFEARTTAQKSLHLTPGSRFPAFHSSAVASHQRHNRWSTVPVPVSPPLAGLGSLHESTKSTSRLLMNTYARPAGEPVDPFATPFDDDARVASPVKTKRTTNPFMDHAV